MARWYIVTMLVLLCCVLVEAQEIENQLVNPDFEEGEVGWVKEEHVGQGAVVQLVVDDAESVTGRQSMQIDIQALDGSGTWWHAGLNQVVAVEGGESYTLALFAKTEPTKARIIRIAGGENHDPWANWGDADIQISDEWLEYSTTWQQAANDDNARIRIAVGQSERNVWVDHVRLYIGEYIPAVLDDEPFAIKSQSKLATTWGGLRQR